jgi:hypothetical protein
MRVSCSYAGSDQPNSTAFDSITFSSPSPILGIVGLKGTTITNITNGTGMPTPPEGNITQTIVITLGVILSFGFALANTIFKAPISES